MNGLSATLLSRLEARDRALFSRCALQTSMSRPARAFWTMLTHAGGASCSLAAAIIPAFAGGALGAAARHAFVTLVVSHIAVQVVKRTVGRPRPSRRTSCANLVQEPDRFSFPSGHSAAAMSVAFVYAMAFPQLALPLLAGAFLVGLSRVFLGVHYPGDVLVGQAIAITTALPLTLR